MSHSGHHYLANDGTIKVHFSRTPRGAQKTVALSAELQRLEQAEL